MKRLIALAAFLVCAVTSVAAHAEEKQYFTLGMNPVDRIRQIDEMTERAVRPGYEKKVTLGQRTGPPVTKWLHGNEIVIVDKATGIAKWMVDCGNPVVWPTDWNPEKERGKPKADAGGDSASPTEGAKKCCGVAANSPPASGGCGSSCGATAGGIDLRKATDYPRQDERPNYLPRPRTCKCGAKGTAVKKDNSAAIAVVAVLGVLALGALAMSQNHDHGGGGNGWSPAPEPPN